LANLTALSSIGSEASDRSRLRLAVKDF